GKDLSLVFNDLEQVVFAGWPELKRFRDDLLEAGAARALLSGSGSTVFGIFRTRAEGEQALGELCDRFSTWKLLVSRTVSDGIRVTDL
ncbi:MAG: hypothetical protein GWN07_06550, partial [Actinobacteria bacterium]|nr:hypothetical protein [Actinomycetota bacterium]NIW26957.1 hypothetical protein [Actinomycetota bacterium]NIX19507.1 hypothetical protein [Actinomycetota bacterium]